MDQQMAHMVVLAGGTIAVLVWLLGVRAFGRISADPGRHRVRVAVRSAGAGALSELVRWASREGWRITDQSGDRIVVDQGRMQVQLVLLRETAGPTLEISADLSAWRRRFLLATGLLVFGVAPVLIIGVVAGLYYLAAPSPVPAVRWQVLQVVQCVHVLWPPFLCRSLYFRVRQQALESIPANLRALIEVANP